MRPQACRIPKKSCRPRAPRGILRVLQQPANLERQQLDGGGSDGYGCRSRYSPDDQALRLQFHLAEVTQANPMRERPGLLAVLFGSAPGTHRDGQRKLCLAGNHLCCDSTATFFYELSGSVNEEFPGPWPGTPHLMRQKETAYLPDRGVAVVQ